MVDTRRLSSDTREELNKILKSNRAKSETIGGKHYWLGKQLKDKIDTEIKNDDMTHHKGGILPLAALIHAIIAGLVGAASGIASTVKKKPKQAQKFDLEKGKLQKEIDSMKPADLIDYIFNAFYNE